MDNQPELSPPAIGVAIFWLAVSGVFAGFLLNGPVSYLLLLCVVPVIYGTHEALHKTLIPEQGPLSYGGRAHNTFAMWIGFATQLMNFRVLKPAHLRHHIHGRSAEGYAPDIISGKKPARFQFAHYYLTLLGLPAIALQLTGFAMLVLPRRLIPFENELPFQLDKSRIPAWLAQVGVIAFLIFAIKSGGLLKFAIYEVFFCVTFSMLQNVSHYGLVGVDEATDRVCARSYDLGPPWRYLTFGSTMHLSHHVDMTIPGLRLHLEETQAYIRNRLGFDYLVSAGLTPFIKAIFAQLRGPVSAEELSTSWIADEVSSPQASLASYTYRKGPARKE